MHASVIAFIKRVATAERVAGRRVLEVGGFNVNGSARDIIVPLGPGSYHAIDIQAQPKYVDEVMDAAELASRFPAGSFDVVVSTEMLEHAERWADVVAGIKHVLAPGGLLILTARGPGMPVHAYPYDHWRFRAEDIAAVFQDYVTLYLGDDPELPGFLYAGCRPPARLPERAPEAVVIPFHSQVAFEERRRIRRLKGTPPAPLKVFYHIACMNNWKDVVAEQTRVFKDNGLTAWAYVLGSEADAAWVLSLGGVHLLGQSPDLQRYETPTLQELYVWCCANPGGAVMYVHTKGVSAPQDQVKVHWRRLMTHYVVKQWPTNLAALADFDMVGVGWTNSVRLPHYSGNFWMARAEWIASLDSPQRYRDAGGPWVAGQSWERMSSEMWIGSRPYHYMLNRCGLGERLWTGPKAEQLLKEAEEASK